MAIDSAISGIGLLKVSPAHDDKAKQGSHHQDGRKKHAQDESPGPQPVPSQRGQTKGMVIDITI